MKPHLIVFLAISCLSAASLRAQPVEPSDPAPTLKQLKRVWTPKAQWANHKSKREALDLWKVVSFRGDLLTISHPSRQPRGCVTVTLEITEDGGLEVVRAAHADTPKAVESRGHRGTGWIGVDALQFEMDAEMLVEGREEWQPWMMSVRLTRFEQLDARELLKPSKGKKPGTRLVGRRTEVEPADAVATMEVEVVKRTPRHLWLRADERWRGAKKNNEVTWVWKFEADGTDPKTEQPRWKLVDGTRVSRGETKHRSNWRGYVVLSKEGLRGEYGYDWRGMKAAGHRPGRKDYTHPLVLSFERSPAVDGDR